MVQKVDPFIHPIPKSLLNNPDTRSFFEYLTRWCHDMWRRTGGGDDLIADTGTRESYPWSEDVTEGSRDSFYSSLTANTEIDQEISYNFPIDYHKTFNAVSTSNNYTAADWDWVNAKRASTITFPQYPSAGAEIIIRVGDNTFIGLNGNGKNIDGSSTGVLRRKGTSIRFKYFIDDDEWFPI